MTENKGLGYGCICSNKDKNFKANHNFALFISAISVLYL